MTSVLRSHARPRRGRPESTQANPLLNASAAAANYTVMSPDAALQELLAGNRRFAANQLTSIEHDLSILKEHTVEKQEPFAAVLACADSRVPVELVFDQSIGQLFVTRVAGNIMAPDVIASLEYALAELGVGLVLVLGHTQCGAVSAAKARISSAKALDAAPALGFAGAGAFNASGKLAGSVQLSPVAEL